LAGRLEFRLRGFTSGNSLLARQLSDAEECVYVLRVNILSETVVSTLILESVAVATTISELP
jgi:hypothetical protein